MGKNQVSAGYAAQIDNSVVKLVEINKAYETANNEVKVIF